MNQVNFNISLTIKFMFINFIFVYSPLKNEKEKEKKIRKINLEHAKQHAACFFSSSFLSFLSC